MEREDEDEGSVESVGEASPNAEVDPRGKLEQGKQDVTSQETKNTGGEQFDLVWQRVRERLKIELGPQRFQYWIDPLRPTSAEGGRVVIACTSRFERDKVVESHGERIANMIAEIAPEFAEVDFVVDVKPRAVSVAISSQLRVGGHEGQTHVPFDPVLAEGSSPLNPLYAFESFVTGRSNQIAFQEARRVAESDVPIANPIFFFGPTGFGKTHLMHAIARQ